MNPLYLHHEPKSKYAYLFDKDTVHLRLFAAKGTIDTVAVLYGDPFLWGPAEDNPETWEWKRVGTETSFMTKEYETQSFDHFFFAAKPPTKRMRYAFFINGTHLYGSRELVDLREFPKAINDHFNYFNFPFLNEEDLFQAPSWVKDQIWYSIFPERFANGDPTTNVDGTLAWGDTDSYSNNQRFGGDLQGIIDHLDHIQDMGFTGLYMTPIFPSDSSHKYDVNDYLDIDPAFGDKATFHRLVQAVHERGMKIMLDAVYNHCGFRHPFFQDVLRNGTKSKYYDCFYIIDATKPIIPFELHEDGTIDRKSVRKVFQDKSKLNYRTFAFTPFMPKLNTTHPIMKEHLLHAATYWIKEFDIDGWRLDVSDEVPHAFWRDFRIAVKTAKPDAYIIGENWADSTPWLRGDQYDGVMNYELLFPIWDYFGLHKSRKRSSSTTFVHHVNHVFTNYPKNVLPYLYNLVDSHDTTRILEVCDNDPVRVQLPYLFLFSLPGSPSIYYGGEIGLSGGHDPDNRRCMIWDDTKWDDTIRTFLKTVIRLRKEHMSFGSVDFEWLDVSDKDDYLVYRKEDTLFFLSRNTKEVSIKRPASCDKKTYRNLFTGDILTLDQTIVLPPLSYLVIQIVK